MCQFHTNFHKSTLEINALIQLYQLNDISEINSKLEQISFFYLFFLIFLKNKTFTINKLFKYLLIVNFYFDFTKNSQVTFCNLERLNCFKSINKKFN